MTQVDHNLPRRILLRAALAILVSLPVLLYLIPAGNGGLAVDVPFLALILVVALVRQWLALGLLAAALAIVRKFPSLLAGLGSLVGLFVAHAVYWAMSSRAQLEFPASVLPMTPRFNVQANILTYAASLEVLCAMYSFSLLCCTGGAWLWRRRQRGSGYAHCAVAYAAVGVLYALFAGLHAPGAIRGATP